MATQFSRHLNSAAPNRRRRLARFTKLRIAQLEDRTAPALFNVQTPQSFAGLDNNGCVAVADFDKNGRMDAVFTNFGTDYGSGAGDSIVILYGNEAGGFTRVEPLTGGRNVCFASVGDINGDTWLDLVVCNANQQNTGSVTVFKNNSGNLIQQGLPFSTFGNNSSWVGLADMTSDNIPDVIVGSFGREVGEDIVGNNVTIFQGNGDFTFAASPITTLRPELAVRPDGAGQSPTSTATATRTSPPSFRACRRISANRIRMGSSMRSRGPAAAGSPLPTSTRPPAFCR